MNVAIRASPPSGFASNAAMTTEVDTVTPSTPIHDAAKTLLEHKIGALPVVEGERLVGIISTSDVLRAFLEAN